MPKVQGITKTAKGHEKEVSGKTKKDISKKNDGAKKAEQIVKAIKAQDIVKTAVKAPKAKAPKHISRPRPESKSPSHSERLEKRRESLSKVLRNRSLSRSSKGTKIEDVDIDIDIGDDNKNVNINIAVGSSGKGHGKGHGHGHDHGHKRLIGAIEDLTDQISDMGSSFTSSISKLSSSISSLTTENRELNEALTVAQENAALSNSLLEESVNKNTDALSKLTDAFLKGGAAGALTNGNQNLAKGEQVRNAQAFTESMTSQLNLQSLSTGGGGVFSGAQAGSMAGGPTNAISNNLSQLLQGLLTSNSVSDLGSSENS